MKDMKKKIMTMAACSLLAVLNALAGVNTDRLHISNLSVNKGDSLMTLNMIISPDQWQVKGNNIVTLTPLLVSETDTLWLQPVRIAGKQAWYSEVRSGREVPRAGKSPAIEYTATVPFSEAFMRSQVVIVADTASICNCNPPASGTTPIINIDYNRPRLHFPFKYEAPVSTGRKTYTLSGRANIIFKVNRTDIDWTYMGNYAELDTIVRTINVVRDNTDATVDSICLTGYASPEGPYKNNVRLAIGRTNVVKQYVADRSTFSPKVYRAHSVPEDWAGLRAWLVASNVPDRDAMIAFIDDPSVPVETKNDVFRRRFPEAYDFLLKNVYPLLRHTDYIITYTVRNYDDLAEIARVLKTRPGNLSPDEVFRLAMSYGEGTPEYDETMITAARLFPDNPIANLNAANSSMNSGEYKSARYYLSRLPDGGDKYYTTAILETLEGNYPAALQMMRKAAEAGVPGAEAAIQSINSIMSYEKIEIL